uniref:DAGKa domain-containing protein n=1 Tax=Macrostomum lignano TaxID=282301 RepID=A0A1I8FPR2_9PLAT
LSQLSPAPLPAAFGRSCRVAGTASLIVPASAPEAAGHRDSVPAGGGSWPRRALLVNSIDGWSVSGCLKRQHEAANPVGVHQRGVQPARQPGAAQRGDRRLRQFVQPVREWRRPVLDALLFGGALQAFKRPGDLARSVAAGRAASEATGRQRALDALGGRGGEAAGGTG